MHDFVGHYVSFQGLASLSQCLFWLMDFGEKGHSVTDEIEVNLFPITSCLDTRLGRTVLRFHPAYPGYNFH